MIQVKFVMMSAAAYNLPYPYGMVVPFVLTIPVRFWRELSIWMVFVLFFGSKQCICYLIARCLVANIVEFVYKLSDICTLFFVRCVVIFRSLSLSGV